MCVYIFFSLGKNKKITKFSSYIERELSHTASLKPTTAVVLIVNSKEALNSRQ